MLSAKPTEPVAARFAPEEVAVLDRLASAGGITRSAALRWLVGQRLRDERPSEAAFIEALRATGARATVKVNRARPGRPPTAQVLDVEAGAGPPLKSLAEFKVSVSRDRVRVDLVGVGSWSGVTLPLTLLPAALTTTIEVNLADLGEFLAVA